MGQHKHTPGPWVANQQDCDGEIINSGTFPFQIESSDWVICEVYGDVPEIDAQANARLIAAAPDLLAALEGLLALYQSQPRETTPQEIAAEYAIAKATGGDA